MGCWRLLGHITPTRSYNTGFLTPTDIMWGHRPQSKPMMVEQALNQWERLCSSFQWVWMILEKQNLVKIFHSKPHTPKAKQSYWCKMVQTHGFNMLHSYWNSTMNHTFLSFKQFSLPYKTDWLNQRNCFDWEFVAQKLEALQQRNTIIHEQHIQMVMSWNTQLTEWKQFERIHEKKMHLWKCFFLNVNVFFFSM